ncbi:ABC transporter related protein [Caldalkalibacillus thermarum TA2.A1]|uniref:ABC transporter ATP-binding protein n=1 Tax=Caldalkalibacillus thermarum (strain TA2.A1) TaxID=986075 RepID=F5L5A2_CALTT|nr:ABC transporter ATP-binding protein [Caldalkalibacillus thermarum]EGL83470.1 ABC transporter related protein [Caldalkalibacillus thermarum TA2.A1]QZT34622.1 ABC transporter ATP-binding protein [Caldalkalibacillus thermarum TA2.A1]
MIHLDNVTKVYTLNNQTIHALKQVTLMIKKGEWLSILGPSGSGKSTLLGCIGGMLHPDHGSVSVNGQDLATLSDEELQRFRRQTIGFVFQDFRLLPQYTVLENVMLPQLPYQATTTVRQRAVQLIGQLGLSHRLHHVPAELSGGEQQRVSIARALMNEPAVLLCDEPTGNLDRDNRDRILDVFSQLHSSGCTIILATHDPEVAQRGTRELYLRDGYIQREVVRCSG